MGEVGLDFEDLVTALEPPPNHAGTTAQAAELAE
ncbi:hypothetical protein ACVIIY_004066 [Bradyrhizobium sp. USDA 4515]